MSEQDNFWDEGKDEADNLKMGTSYPPVRVFLTAIDLARLNSNEALIKEVILSDGKEVDLEIYLETDRTKFTKDLREAIDEKD